MALCTGSRLNVSYERIWCHEMGRGCDLLFSEAEITFAPNGWQATLHS